VLFDERTLLMPRIIGVKQRTWHTDRVRTPYRYTTGCHETRYLMGVLVVPGTDYAPPCDDRGMRERDCQYSHRGGIDLVLNGHDNGLFSAPVLVLADLWWRLWHGPMWGLVAETKALIEWMASDKRTIDGGEQAACKALGEWHQLCLTASKAFPYPIKILPNISIDLRRRDESGVDVIDPVELDVTYVREQERFV
jgi:hypothetical protein